MKWEGDTKTVFDLQMIEETMTHEKHKTTNESTKMFAGKSEKLIVVCIYDETGCFWALNEREYLDSQ